MMTRSHVLARIQMRKAFGISVVRKVMPRQLSPDAIKLEYAKALLPFIQEAWKLVEREVLPLVKQELGRQDADWNALLDKLNERYFANLSTHALSDVIRRFASRTSAWNKAQLHSQVVAALGVELPFHEPGFARLVDSFLSENLALVKTIPNRFLDDVEREVVRAVRQGVRYADLAETLTARFGVAEREAERVARDQVGKFYADVNKARQEDLGLTGYVWRTMNDGRVRDDHQRREGKKFTWAKAPAGGHPGEAVLCRCYAEPDLSPFLEAA
jgi:SPP1 gp7 family putative phage head morphogenesis protein